MGSNWSRYEGQSIAGWRIESFLGERDGKGFFAAHDEGGSKTVLLQLVPAGRQANAALASWSLAKNFADEYRLKVYAAAEQDIGGERFVYAALDLPDDDLSEILPRRPLEDAEVRAILRAAALALEYLHDQNLTHGAVLPANTFLVGEQWKLSVDTLAPANPQRRTEDMRQLGATLVWMLTGGATDPLQPPSTESIARLDPRFREIAVGCLNGWTARQVVAALDGRSAPPQESPKTAAAAAAQKGRSNTWPVITAIIAALVLVLAYLLNARSGRDVTASSRATLPPPKTAEARAERPIPAVKPAQNGNADREIAAPHPRRSSWAVIAATYDRRADADKRATQIHARWHQFDPRVYPPDRRSGEYYVVLGSGLSRNAADALRRRARSAGVSGDSYTTKLQD